MNLPPWGILIGAVGLLIIAWFADRSAARRHAAGLRRIAAELQVHYSRVDRFDIARRLVAHFPVKDAADLVVSDLMYRRGNGYYSYVFTTDFRTGPQHDHHQIVAAVDEPADRSLPLFERITLADGDKPLQEQYRALLSHEC